MIKETNVKNEFEETERELKVININDLLSTPKNNYELVDIPELAGNIKSVGLLTPLSVIGPNENGKYEILSGNRRFTAININNEEVTDEDKMTEIPCYILGPITMNATVQKLIIESSNLETRDENKDKHRFNIIRLLKDLADSGDISKSKIVHEAGKYMKMSNRYRSMYLHIFNKGVDELKDLVGTRVNPESKKALSVTDANTIASFDKETQKEVIAELKEGKSPTKAIEERKAIKQNNLKKNIEGNDVETEEETRDLTMNDADREEIIDFLDNGNLEDADTDDLFDAFMKDSESLNLSVDTTGELKTMKASDIEDVNYNNFLKKVINWTKSMKKAIDYTNEELETVEAVRDMLETLDADAFGIGA